MRKLLITLFIALSVCGFYLWNSSNAFQEIPYDYYYGKYEQPGDNAYKIKEYQYYINKVIFPVIKNYNPDEKFIEAVEHFHKKMQWEYNTIFPDDPSYYKGFRQSLMFKMIIILIKLPETRKVDTNFFDLVQGLDRLGGYEEIDDAFFYSFRVLDKRGEFKDSDLADVFIDTIIKSSDYSEYNYRMSDYIIEDVAKYSKKYSPEKVQVLLH